MKWTVEFSQEEIEAIAKAVSVAFVDKDERARVVLGVFMKAAERARFL